MALFILNGTEQKNASIVPEYVFLVAKLWQGSTLMLLEGRTVRRQLSQGACPDPGGHFLVLWVPTKIRNWEVPPKENLGQVTRNHPSFLSSSKVSDSVFWACHPWHLEEYLPKNEKNWASVNMPPVRGICWCHQFGQFTLEFHPNIQVWIWELLNFQGSVIVFFL